jgi:tRNA 5-methylaminomethyl-2-thiouridine biosynthesis bifunctional protein
VPQAGGYIIGATYDHDDLSLHVRPEHHAKNLAELAEFLPDWAQIDDPALLTGRIAHRVTTPSRRPLVGLLDGARFPTLYSNAAHGSRGLLTAPYGAERVADQIEGACVQLRG